MTPFTWICLYDVHCATSYRHTCPKNLITSFKKIIVF